jgi:hypothetical protein
MKYFTIKSHTGDYLATWKWSDNRIHLTDWGSASKAHRFLTQDEARAFLSFFAPGTVELVPHGDFALQEAGRT